MEKHRPYNKLTSEQRRDIGILVNSGLSRNDLIDSYKVSRQTIGNIQRQRIEWIPADEIITERDNSARFKYGQKAYVELSMGAQAKGLLEQKIIDPMVDALIQSIDPEVNIKFIYSLFNRSYKSKLGKRYSTRLKSIAKSALLQQLEEGTRYNNINEAVNNPHIPLIELEEDALTPKQKSKRHAAKNALTTVLDTLSYKEREIIKLRYGVCSLDH